MFTVIVPLRELTLWYIQRLVEEISRHFEERADNKWKRKHSMYVNNLHLYKMLNCGQDGQFELQYSE